MKKYFLVLIIVLSFFVFSCSGSGGGSDSDGENTAPVVKEFEFRSDPYSDTVPASFDVGNDIYMTFAVSDKDKDIKSYFLTIRDTTTLAIIMDKTEYELEQTDETHFFYTQVDSSAAGTSTYEFYLTDKAGNTSTTIKKNLIIN